MENIQQNIQQVISKINKLLNLSKSSNVNEAAAAAAAADRLMQNYRISTLELSLSNKEEEAIVLIEEYLHTSGRLVLWKNVLASILCDHYGCAYFIQTVPNNKDGTRSTTKALRVFGCQSDFDIVKYMYGYLTTEIERLTKLEASGKGAVFSQSYSLGAVQGIKDQLKKSIDKMRQENTSSAMVLLSSRAEKSTAMMNSKLNLKKAPTSKQHYNSDGYNTGRERGQNIQLRTGLNGKTDNVKQLN